MVVNIPEVDLGVGSEHRAGTVGQDAQGIPLGRDVPPQVQYQALDSEDLSQRILVELREDLLLQTVHELIQAFDNWEVRVNRLIHNSVHQPRRPVTGELGLSAEQFLRCRDRVGIGAVYGNQVVLAEEESDVDRLEVVRILGGLAKGDGSDDEEDVLIELFQFDSRLGIHCFFDRQRMELEDLLQERNLTVIAGIDIHPKRPCPGGEQPPDFVLGQILFGLSRRIAVAAE